MRRLHTLATLALLAVAISPLPSSGFQGSAPAAATESRVVLWQPDDAGGAELSGTWREAIGEVLRAVAAAAGVVICPGNEGHVAAGGGLEETCAAGPETVYELWWTADVRVAPATEELATVHMTLSLQLRRDGTLMDHAPGLFVLQQSTRTDPGLTSAELEPGIATRLQSALLEMSALRRWFDQVAERQDLPRREVEVRAAAEPPPPEPAEAGPAEVAEEPSEEADAPPEPPEPPPAEDTAAPESAEEPAEPEPFDVTFRVRMAKPGRGFTAGTDGRLRLSDEGIAFTPAGAAAGGSWFMAWSAFESAGPADGIWDAPFPLVLRDRQGRQYFLAQVDRSGRYSDGKLLLAEIARGQRRASGGA